MNTKGHSDGVYDIFTEQPAITTLYATFKCAINHFYRCFFAIIACDSIHMSAGHESNHETSHMINDVI